MSDRAMRWWCAALVLALLALAAVRATAEPLTPAEAAEYVQRFPTAAAEDVLALDAIERAVPAVAMPELVLSWTANGVALGWSGPLTMDVAGRLQYELTLPPAYARDPRRRPVWPWVATAGAGALAGLALGILLAR